MGQARRGTERVNPINNEICNSADHKCDTNNTDCKLKLNLIIQN